jgi:hypothetical protein
MSVKHPREAKPACTALYCVAARLLPVAGALAACSDCDRQGCDAMHERAHIDGVTAIAGNVGVLSDVSADRCTECPLGDAQIELWATPSLVEDEWQAGYIANGSSADEIFTASGAYRHSLQSGGDYLLCVRPYCYGVRVPASITVTVNIKNREEGPTGFFVGDIGGELQEEFGFDVRP